MFNWFLLKLRLQSCYPAKWLIMINIWPLVLWGHTDKWQGHSYLKCKHFGHHSYFYPLSGMNNILALSTFLQSILYLIDARESLGLHWTTLHCPKAIGFHILLTLFWWTKPFWIVFDSLFFLNGTLKNFFLNQITLDVESHRIHA